MHWCSEHLFQSARKTHGKKMHMYIYIHTYAYAYICTRIRMYIHNTAQHADALLLRLTIYAQICIHIHIHMYVLVHIHMHIYTYTHVCTHTYIHVYTHTYTTCTSARTQARLERRRSSMCARCPGDLTPGSSALLPVNCNPEVGHPQWPASRDYICFIMSFHFLRHNNAYNILLRHNDIFKNGLTFIRHKF